MSGCFPTDLPIYKMVEKIQLLEKRIKELEIYPPLIKSLNSSKDDLQQQINDLHKKFDYWFDNGIKRIIKLEQVNKELVDKIAEIANLYYQEKKKPYKCPICDGLGGTIISGVIDEDCNTCKGKGIVWG